MQTKMTAKEFRDKYVTGKDKNSVTVPAANLEQNAGNEPVAKARPKTLASPCNITFHSVRKRLADNDGLSGKACLDGLVHAGVLQDDSPKEVKKVSHSQEKTKKGEEEYTIIEIEVIE